MTDTMRVLVTGGRDYSDKARVWKELYRLSEIDETHLLGRVRLVVIHGDAEGADRMADEWAVVNWHEPLPFPADWKSFGKAAGGIRNQQMIDEGRPDIVLAFPGGAGTRDMIMRAVQAGVPVFRIE